MRPGFFIMNLNRNDSKRGPLKESMKGIHFQTDEEVKAAVSNWLRTQSTEFYAKGIDNLISRWNKCVAKEGDYVEK